MKVFIKNLLILLGWLGWGFYLYIILFITTTFFENTTLSIILGVIIFYTSYLNIKLNKIQDTLNKIWKEINVEFRKL